MTAISEVAPAKAPTPAQVDALVSEYAKAQGEATAAATAAKVAQGLANEVKDRLVAMVELHGFRHTEKSKRLAGLHNTATTTTATRVSVDDAAVGAFRSYLEDHELAELSGRFFVEHVSYSLVEGPQEVLKRISVGKRIREKIASLLGLCFQIKTNAPSLKIETVDPQ
jgi:hypothetical protein